MLPSLPGLPDFSSLLSDPTGFIQSVIDWIVQIVTQVFSTFGVNVG